MSVSPIRTTCPYCGVGCGVAAGRDPAGAVTIAGDPDHPANYGRLCSKGMALAETIGREGRLLFPEIGGRRVSWGAAIDAVADGFRAIIAAHGPDAVAFYVSGQLLTEDYYVANKLMKGFIGSANIDTNSRLCMASSVSAHRRAFGADVVPGCYEDLEEADLVILVGSNLAWCHPILYQRMMAARERRSGLPRIVVIDPRRSATATSADLHLAVAPDSDVALFAGLLAFLEREGRIDFDYVVEHTGGLTKTLSAARHLGLDKVAELCAVARADLGTFYRWFADTSRVVTVYSQGVNQSVTGTDKVNAIINCHLATGRIALPGAGPFSVTGQPNAMGGREVGGMANQLAAHLVIENPEHRRLVQDFWKAPAMPRRAGLKAVELFEAMARGRVKAVWIMGTNPVDSMPDADRVAAALTACPLVVVSDIVAENDTLPFADIRLPAAGWGEKDGTVTNSERRISRQRRFLPLPGEAKPDWWIISQVARRMGFAAAFDYADASDIFREHATLATLANPNGPLDLGSFAELDRAGYDRLAPSHWPWPRRGDAAKRVFSSGRFATPDGRAAFIPTPLREPEERPSAAYPLILNTGRIRDQWHTLTRTGRSPRLWSHIAEPFVEISPRDAAKHGIAAATIVRVRNRRGAVLLRALVSDGQQTGSVFVPMHWNGQFAAAARVDVLVGTATDPISGQPALKFTPVDIEPAGAVWYGFAVLTDRPRGLESEYWALATTKSGFRLEMAGLTPMVDPDAFAARLFGDTGGASTLSYRDAATGGFRFTCSRDSRLRAALFLAPTPVAVSRGWAVGRLGGHDPDGMAGLDLAAGRPGNGRPDEGAIVCSCHEVGANRLAAVIAAGARDLEGVGRLTGAGTNCGSCRPEIRKLVDAVAVGPNHFADRA